jgi:hypothetical protein
VLVPEQRSRLLRWWAEFVVATRMGDRCFPSDNVCTSKQRVEVLFWADTAQSPALNL